MTTLLIIAVFILALYLISKALDKTSKGTRSTTPTTYRREPVSPPQKMVGPPKKPRTDIDLSGIEINDDFKAALELIEGRNESVYVTGKAGTGKSTLLKYLRATTKKNVVVLAPTGLAAINVGGQTIHSFFKLPPKLIKVEDIHPSRNAILYQKLDAVIIDEVSMVRADLMDGIDYSLRINRRKMNEPFGGTQMVFFGDLFQLPPIVKGRDLEDFFNHLIGVHSLQSNALVSGEIYQAAQYSFEPLDLGNHDAAGLSLPAVCFSVERIELPGNAPGKASDYGQRLAKLVSDFRGVVRNGL